MSAPAERRYHNAKLSYEECLAGLRRWPGDRQIQIALRVAKRKLSQAREELNVSRHGR